MTFPNKSRDRDEGRRPRLGEPELARLSRVAEPRTLGAGEMAGLTAGPLGSVLVVRSGRLMISRASVEGKELIFGFLDSGELFVPPVDRRGKGSQLQVGALSDAVFMLLRQRDLETFLLGRPGVTLVVLRQLAARVRALEEWIEELAFKDTGARLASALLRLSEAYGSREMVTHTLVAWKRRGWVEGRGRWIILSRPEVPESVATGEPRLTEPPEKTGQTGLAEPSHADGGIPQTFPAGERIYK